MAHGETRIDGEAFRVTTWTIQPGDAIPMHRHELDYVVVPLAEASMVAVLPDGSEQEIELRPGVPYARCAGAEHRIENRGARLVTFTEVERRR